MIHDDELDGNPVRFDVRPPRPRWRTSPGTMINVVIVLGCGFVLLSFLLPTSSHCGESMRRAQCVNNLKQIQLGLESYHQNYGAFPPAYVADASGRRLHSWRVLILPFLDLWPDADRFHSLYDRYDFTEPWDGPHNTRLLDEMPELFRCPSHMPPLRGGTSYVAIGGPGTMFPGPAPVGRADVKDGLSGTLAVVEVANLPVPWTAPLDLDARTLSFAINDLSRPAIGSPHPGGANVGTGEGRVCFLREGIPPEVLRAMTTIAGGEKINVEEALNSR